MCAAQLVVAVYNFIVQSDAASASEYMVLRNLKFKYNDFLPSLEPVRTTPLALNMVVLVDPREEVFLQVPESPPRHGLVVVATQHSVESLLRNTTILELSEHDLAILGQQRAGSVAVV